MSCTPLPVLSLPCCTLVLWLICAPLSSSVHSNPCSQMLEQHSCRRRSPFENHRWNSYGNLSHPCHKLQCTVTGPAVCHLLKLVLSGLHKSSNPYLWDSEHTSCESIKPNQPWSVQLDSSSSRHIQNKSFSLSVVTIALKCHQNVRVLMLADRSHTAKRSCSSSPCMCWLTSAHCCGSDHSCCTPSALTSFQGGSKKASAQHSSHLHTIVMVLLWPDNTKLN